MPEQPDLTSIGNLTPEHLRSVFEITLTMNSSLEFDQALINVMDAMVRATHAERGVLLGVDEESGAVKLLAAQGLHGEALTQEEAYSTTIVNHVITTRETLLTNNALFDTRISPGQSIVMRALRAILCAPIMIKDRLIGVVYVDTSMRTGNFTLADRDLLKAIAYHAALTLENARLYTIAVEKGRLENELNLARRIQWALLPRQLPQVAGYEVAAHLQSAREMAGDFYDALQLSDTQFAVSIADVSDKGAASAMFMAVARSMIRSYAYAGFAPLETMSRTNDLILEDAESGMFVTVYHSIFERGGKATHINAGHNPPLLYHAADASVSSLSRGGRAIGWFPANPLHQSTMQLAVGDVIVYYTDGLTEYENAQGEPFGEQRLMTLMREFAKTSADTLMSAILDAVVAFAGGLALTDDLTLLIVRYAGE